MCAVFRYEQTHTVAKGSAFSALVHFRRISPTQALALQQRDATVVRVARFPVPVTFLYPCRRFRSGIREESFSWEKKVFEVQDVGKFT